MKPLIPALSWRKGKIPPHLEGSLYQREGKGIEKPWCPARLAAVSKERGCTEHARLPESRDQPPAWQGPCGLAAFDDGVGKQWASCRAHSPRLPEP